MPAGKEIVLLSRKHIGEKYVLGASAPKDNGSWKGPWDCAEFTSWLVFQLTGTLYGCLDNTAKPYVADAFTGSWARDGERIGKRISVEEAAGTPGAFVLRCPNEAGIRVGHIVVSDGKGGTVEAHSSKKGVIASTLSGRRWTCGILVPGFDYDASGEPEIEPAPAAIYRLADPPMTGSVVLDIQRRLKAAGFSPGVLDGVFGPHTMAAVVSLQRAKGLAPDGEVGRLTAQALRRASS